MKKETEQVEEIIKKELPPYSPREVMFYTTYTTFDEKDEALLRIIRSLIDSTIEKLTREQKEAAS